jgi:hypothetical protein
MRRVLSDDGVLVSAYISRFAALMDGYKRRWISNPAYESLSVEDARHGVHDSPDDDKYFTLAFMHRPEEIAAELQTAGFEMLELLAVEGLFWTYPHLAEFVEDPESFARLLSHVELLEREPSIMGASAHFLSTAHKRKG